MLGESPRWASRLSSQAKTSASGKGGEAGVPDDAGVADVRDAPVVDGAGGDAGANAFWDTGDAGSAEGEAFG